MHSRRALLCLGVLALQVAGCSMGPKVADWAPAAQAQGANISLDLRGGQKVYGELLAVDSTQFLVREPGRIVRVSFDAVGSGESFRTQIVAGVPGRELRRQLRLMSRYPQGVSPELEHELLLAYGQDAVLTAP